MRNTCSNLSIPILDYKGPSFDTNINIDILDFCNRYQYQYQYSWFWKSIPIWIPQFWKINYNTNTEKFIFQYQSRSQNQSIAILWVQKLLATSCKQKISLGQVNTNNLKVDKMLSHYIVFLGLAINLGWNLSKTIKK